MTPFLQWGTFVTKPCKTRVRRASAMAQATDLRTRATSKVWQMSKFLSLSLSVSVCHFVSVCLSVCLSVSLSVCLSPVSYTHLTLPTIDDV